MGKCDLVTAAYSRIFGIISLDFDIIYNFKIRIGNIGSGNINIEYIYSIEGISIVI